MNNRLLSICSACMIILFLAANIPAAETSFSDEPNDVFYYENGIVDRENDPHTLSEVPEVDIQTVSFETTTGGTTVYLTVGADIIEDYVDGYDYSIRIYQGATNDFDYYHLWTDNENNGWHSWFNSNEHETYSFDEDTLSIFFAGMSLDASTDYIEAKAVHYRLDEGVDVDWYPDGVEKQDQADSDDDSSDTGDTSDYDTNGTDDTEDGGNEQSDDSTASTPGFELVLVFVGLAACILIFSKKK